MSASFRSRYKELVADDRYMPARSKKNLHVTAAVLAVLGLFLFLVLLRGVLLDDGPTAIDAPVQAWLHAGRTDVVTGIMIGLAIAFGPIALPIIILIIVVTWGIVTRHAWRPLLLAAGTLTGVALALTITHAVGRQRPPTELMLFGADHTFSFPSGHVLGACNFMLLLGYLVFSRQRNPRAGAVVFTAIGLLIVATAVSRVYLGYHWATDVLASISLSLIILGAVIAVDTHHTVRVGDAPVPDDQRASRAP